VPLTEAELVSVPEVASPAASALLSLLAQTRTPGETTARLHLGANGTDVTLPLDQLLAAVSLAQAAPADAEHDTEDIEAEQRAGEEEEHSAVTEEMLASPMVRSPPPMSPLPDASPEFEAEYGAALREWLGGLGLEHHVDAFIAHEIDASALLNLTADDLKEMGVARIGERKRILKAVAEAQATQVTTDAHASPKPTPKPRPKAGSDSDDEMSASPDRRHRRRDDVDDDDDDPYYHTPRREPRSATPAYYSRRHAAPRRAVRSEAGYYEERSAACVIM
jgi:hypothetical protein